jgi:hypothetical protein
MYEPPLTFSSAPTAGLFSLSKWPVEKELDVLNKDRETMWWSLAPSSMQTTKHKQWYQLQYTYTNPHSKYTWKEGFQRTNTKQQALSEKNISISYPTEL